MNTQSDMLHAMVIAGVNAIVVVGCIVIWAVILGVLEW